MNREEIITKIQNKLNKAYMLKSREEVDKIINEIFDDVEKLREAVTLADLPGWEEGVEYILNDDVYKIMNNSLFIKLEIGWYTTELSLCNSDIELLKQAKKVEQNKFYAKVKGADLINNNKKYWNVDTKNSYLYVGNQMETHRFTILLTKEEWNKLGINDTNADFEEVKDEYYG